jgi:hypothetical protein
MNMSHARPMTTILLDALDEGLFDKDALIGDLLGFLSEAEVEEFVRSNDLIAEVLGMNDDIEDDGQPDEAQEWESFDPDC